MLGFTDFLSSAAMHGVIVAGLFAFGWHAIAGIYAAVWVYTWGEYLVKARTGKNQSG
jgi:hypothetical protein